MSTSILHSSALRARRRATQTRLRRFIHVGCLCLLAGLPICRAFAEDLLLSGAAVHTVSGETLSPGQVLIRNHTIAAVGPSLSATDAKVIDLHGQHLYPGMIALNTVLGLTELEDVRATQDNTEVGDYTPDVESWVAVNPDSELIPVARANGIAYFEPVPMGGIVSGQSGLMAVDGWTTEQMVIQKPLALHVFWPSLTLDISSRESTGKKPKALSEQAKNRGARVRGLMDFFEEARAYAKAKQAAENGRALATELIPAWEAMLPYVQGRKPIVVHADEIRQIRAALDWAATNHLRVILAGGRDAWMAASLLASSQIPVLYAHTFTQPARDTESYDAQFTTAEVLRRAGVRVVFTIGTSVFNTPMAANLPYDAAMAVAFGFPKDEALKSLMLYPAQLAGVADRLGSIEPGKEATLFTATGDILDIRANVTHLWIAGHEISLQNRHKRLYEKYRNRPRN